MSTRFRSSFLYPIFPFFWFAQILRWRVGQIPGKEATIFSLSLLLFCSPVSAAATDEKALDQVLRYYEAKSRVGVSENMKLVEYSRMDFDQRCRSIRSMVGRFDPVMKKRVDFKAAETALQQYYAASATNLQTTAKSNQVPALVAADLAVLRAERPLGSRLSKKEESAQRAAWDAWAALNLAVRKSVLDDLRARLARDQVEAAAAVVARREEAAKAFPNATPEELAAIRAGRWFSGMSAEMVRASLGPPRQRTENGDADGTREVWKYGWGTLHFSGGRLQSWTVQIE